MSTEPDPDGVENDGNQPSPPLDLRDESESQTGGMNAKRAWPFVSKFIG